MTKQLFEALVMLKVPVCSGHANHDSEVFRKGGPSKGGENLHLKSHANALAMAHHGNLRQ